MDVYIYALCDPRDDAIRYVGRTVNPKDRYRNHLKAKWNTHRCCWIIGLKELGLMPKMFILEVTDDENCRNSETWWIKHLRENGHDLTNHSDGGDGLLNPTQDTRNKMSANAKRRGGIRPKGYKCTTAEKESNRNAQQKLTGNQVLDIRKILSENFEITYADMAEKYGVHLRTIVNIVNGRTYSHITNADGLTDSIKSNIGKKRVLGRENSLSINTVKYVRELYGSGKSYREVSNKTGVGYQIVWRIIRGVSYSWIK